MKPRYLSLKPLVPWMEAKRPIEWQQLFGRQARLEVEIGFGLGDFIVRRAKEHPDRDFVGIEVAWVPVKRALRKIALAGVDNVRLIRGDARVAIERLFREKSMSGICGLFPCPWPKKNHERRRLFSRPFLSLLNNRLMDDGHVLMVTDDEPYFSWVLSQVRRTGFSAHCTTIPPRFSTKYEQKWHRSGQQEFFELRLTKKGHVDIPAKEEANLITYRTDRFDPESFVPLHRRGRITVESKEFLYDPKQEKGMVRIIVAEDGLLQNFWIEIVRLEGLWHIRPAKGCSMIPTGGVQKALDLVRDAAADQEAT